MNDRVQQGIALVDEMNADELNQLVDYIRQVFKSKRDQDAARVRASLHLGDVVKISGNIKPQYLQGLTGKVVEFKNSRVLVELDRGPVRKFRTGRVLCSPTALKKLTPADTPLKEEEI